jgi:Protein of unknown function (DUF2752)
LSIPTFVAQPAVQGRAENPGLVGWVRGILVGMAVGLIAVFGLAAWLNPYNADGSPRRQEVHLRLGLPPCAYYRLYGQPCAACGMTTSFSLLMHGDVPASLHANSVGTFLALFGLLLIPWSLASALRGRPYLVSSLPRAGIIAGVICFALMILRWRIVLWMARTSGVIPPF